MLFVKLKCRAYYFKFCWKLLFVPYPKIWVKLVTDNGFRMKTDEVPQRWVRGVRSPCWSLAGWLLVISCARLMKSDAVVNQLVSQCVVSVTRQWFSMLDCRLESACWPFVWCSLGIIGVCLLRWWLSRCCWSSVIVFVRWVNLRAHIMSLRKDVACLIWRCVVVVFRLAIKLTVVRTLVDFGSFFNYAFYFSFPVELFVCCLFLICYQTAWGSI